MEELREDIRQLMTQAGEMPFFQLLEQFCKTLASHPQALGGLAGSYRLQTTDTDVKAGFALGENSFRFLADDEKADATISAREEDLLALIRRELNPMTALFTGKLRVQGSMQALSRFAQIL